MQRSFKITMIEGLNEVISIKRQSQIRENQNNDPQNNNRPYNDEWHFWPSFRCTANDFVAAINTAIGKMTLIAPLPTLVFQNMGMPASINFQFNNTYEAAKQKVQNANLSNDHSAFLTDLGFTVLTVSRSGAKRSINEAIEDESIHEDFKRMRFTNQ